LCRADDARHNDTIEEIHRCCSVAIRHDALDLDHLGRLEREPDTRRALDRPCQQRPRFSLDHPSASRMACTAVWRSSSVKSNDDFLAIWQSVTSVIERSGV